MRRVRRHISLSLALGVVSLGVILPVGTAMASGGEITQAEASSDWTTAHLAGWASWAGCGVSGPSDPLESFLEGPLTDIQTRAPCYWRPFVTVGPGSTEGDCEENDRLPWSNDETVSLAWTGQEVSTGGTQDFDLPEVPLGKTPGQLACLGFVETVYNTCAPTKGNVCPMWFSATHVGVLDSASLESPEAIVDPKEPPTEPEELEIEEPESEAVEELESEEPAGSETEESESEDTETEPGEWKEPGESPIESAMPTPLTPEQPPKSKQMHRRCFKGSQRISRSDKALCRHRHRRHGRSAHN
jgi:hypothetical protein